MDKLVNVEDIFYVLMSNVSDVRLLKDIINFKESNNLNIKKLPLKAVSEILENYNISDREKIIKELIKEAKNND